MRIPHIAIVAVLLLFARCQANAAPQPNCSGMPLVEVPSLQALPNEINTFLHRDRDVEIASRGEWFNPGDVGEGPHRRFAIAGLNADCAIVAIEHGGRGYSVEIFIFEHKDWGWLGRRDGVMWAVPETLEDLVAHRANGVVYY
ncbi:hypothetical protein [Collimonas sp. OK242]|jgi:hypothetical protein|uniref:hypothetical protein n=1 Tax=Collimonas sp. OK242 TaxID=1798195 RepID=UPI000B83F54E|nr:hypothetical protein [Collimonas sp. OK242]